MILPGRQVAIQYQFWSHGQFANISHIAHQYNNSYTNSANTFFARLFKDTENYTLWDFAKNRDNFEARTERVNSGLFQLNSETS